MNTILELMRDDHRLCDKSLAAAELAGAGGDWKDAARVVKYFTIAMEKHFHAEEEILFPALESITGSEGGPTTVMRLDHNAIREGLEDLAQAVSDGNKKALLSRAETLHFLIQQHNAREEQVLYSMADRMLGEMHDGVVAGLRERIQRKEVA